jgi:hypothetical protein
MSITNPEPNRDMIYFLIGYYFHFTPEEVNKMDVTLVESFMVLLPEWKKRENEVKD